MLVDANGHIKVDLHIHTCYSSDGTSSVEDILTAVQRRGLGAIAITDHCTIAGALAVQAAASFPVIIGEEVETNEGEIIGLFLREPVPCGLTPEETIAHIHNQGGLAYVPHPFDELRRSHLSGRAVHALVAQLDGIEVLNSRVLWSAHNDLARAFAQQHGLAMGAGSDAHIPREIGQAYVEMAPFIDRDSFIAALRNGRPLGSLSWPHVHLFSTLRRAQKPRYCK